MCIRDRFTGVIPILFFPLLSDHNCLYQNDKLFKLLQNFQKNVPGKRFVTVVTKVSKDIINVLFQDGKKGYVQLFSHSLKGHWMSTLPIFPAKKSPINECVIFAHSKTVHWMSRQGMLIIMNTT